MQLDTGTIACQAKHLPDDFVFSQSSLQSYVDCKRRFWLSYVERLPWPSVQAAPVAENEQNIRLGAAFHRLVQRAEEGVGGAAVVSSMEYPLAGWFQSYQDFRPRDLPGDYLEVERTLEIPIGDGGITRRLMAKFDLIAAAAGGKTVIVDWKTGSRIPRPDIVQKKLQTSVYPFVLVEAGASLAWGPIDPEMVEMRYWSVSAPDRPLVFKYDAVQHASNRERLASLVCEIVRSDIREDYPKVADSPFARKYLCGYCNYRSLCDRGVTPSHEDELEDFASDETDASGGPLDFSMDDVDVIAF